MAGDNSSKHPIENFRPYKVQGLSMNDGDNILNMKAVSLVHFVPKSISISM